MATLGRRILQFGCKLCFSGRNNVSFSNMATHRRSRFLSSSCVKPLQRRTFRTASAPIQTDDRHEWEDPKSEDEIVNVVFVTKDGTRQLIRGKVGDNLMYLAHRYEIPVEGACEASLACCTCHVYVKDEYYDKLPDADEKEEDMLDMAPFLKVNSRLSCQIILDKDLEGLEVELPIATRNFYVDGHVPEPH